MAGVSSYAPASFPHRPSQARQLRGVFAFGAESPREDDLPTMGGDIPGGGKDLETELIVF